MKKEIKISLAVLLGFLAFLWLEKPFRELLIGYQMDEFAAKHISGIIVRLILIGAALKLIKELKLIEFSGLRTLGDVENKQAVIIPLVIIMMGFFANWKTYTDAEFGRVLLFLVATFAVGIVEEFVFRGILFPLFIRALKNNARTILLSAVLSSLMFGSVHFINLFSQPGNFMGITSQVFFALSIGVFFCGLMVRTENILIPCLIHGLVNFSFGSGELKQAIVETAKESESAGVNWNSVIPTTLFFLFIFGAGVYMIKKSNRERILRKVVF